MECALSEQADRYFAWALDPGRYATVKRYVLRTLGLSVWEWILEPIETRLALLTQGHEELCACGALLPLSQQPHTERGIPV